MTSTQFHIPNTGLYLGADGLFSPMVVPSDSVLELTSERAQEIELRYRGQVLRQMTILNHSTSAHGDNAGAELAMEVFEWFSLGFEYFEFVEKLNNWISGAHHAPDPIMQSLKALHERLSQIEDTNLAAWMSAREDNLAFLLAHSSNAIKTANDFVQTKADRNDPVWAAQIAIAKSDSRKAVDTLRDTTAGYWLRPESLAAMSWAGNPMDYYHGWMRHIPDRAEPFYYKRVWDYRWALPALLYTIAARLIVLKAFETGSAAERGLYCQEIKEYVKLLGAVFSKRLSGIRTLNSYSDLQYERFLTQGHIPMVAADIYGGDYLGGVYFLSYFRNKRFPPGIASPYMDTYINAKGIQDQAWVESLVTSFARHWWSLLYLRTGLFDLFLVISELQAICDEPWFPRVLVDVHKEFRLVETDDEARKAAFAAVALSDLVPSGDEVDRAVRTNLLYEAMRGGGDAAWAIAASYVRDLNHLRDVEVRTNATS